MKGFSDLFGSKQEESNSSGIFPPFGKKDEESGHGSIFPTFGKQESKTNIVPQFVQNSVNNVKESIPGFQEEPACAKCCPKLTFKQRIIGFFSCAGLGYLLSLIGTLTLIGGPSPTNIRTFACLYVFGNVIALFATGFLLGPKTQCRQMWHPTRRYSCAFYLAMLIIVFSVAVAKQHVLLVLFLLLIQILAALWYSISYIPFARKLVITFLKSTICKPCWEAYEDMKGKGGDSGSSG